MAPRSRILRYFPGPLAIAVAFAAPAAFGAPPSSPTFGSGLVVSRGAHCSVALVATSYDDPGADDAEFVELRVVASPRLDAGAPLSRAGTSANTMSHADAAAHNADASPSRGAAPHAGADASPSHSGTDDSKDANADSTLASCGLDAMELVDGASGGCATYRTIPLGAVPVPTDGYVVLCVAGSTVDERAHCDVTTAGRSALRAGWLQNGPNDGFRFVPVADGPVAVAYEGGPACFPTGSAELATESGAVGGDATVDDVNVACGGHFVLLPEGAVPLRAEPTCPAAAASGLDAAVDGTADASGMRAGSDAGLDASWAPERAPPPANRGSSHTYGPLSIDASLLGAEPSPRPPPSAPGCAVAHTNARGRNIVTAAFVVLALFGFRRSRRRRVVLRPRQVLPDPEPLRARPG